MILLFIVTIQFLTIIIIHYFYLSNILETKTTDAKLLSRTKRSAFSKALKRVSYVLFKYNVCSKTGRQITKTFDFPYLTAASNTIVIGTELGELTKEIDRRNLKNSNKNVKYVCIGHSLGAHTCGFIGQTFKELDVIIAMDPAGPILETNSEHKRLSKDDAKVVQVFHTDKTFLGMKQPAGDIDIYVNGGFWQYGCLELPSDAICSHSAFNLLQQLWNQRSNGRVCTIHEEYECFNAVSLVNKSTVFK